MSLRGKTVVVTRAVDQAPELAALLVDRGAAVVVVPCVLIGPPDDEKALQNAAKDGQYDWILFSSRNAAERFLDAAPLAQGRARIGAVGAKTAAYLTSSGLTVDRVPAEYYAEALLASLGDVRGQRVLVPRAPEGRTALVEGLRAGGARVDAPEAYRLLPAPAPTAEERAAIARAEVFTFLSGRTLEQFLAAVPEARSALERAVVAVIGPVAAETARALGVRVDLVPPEATIESLVDALDVL